MLLNLSDVLTSEGMEIREEIPLEMTCHENGKESFAIVSKSPVRLTVANEGTDRARLRAEAHLTFQASCDRCLADVPVTMDLDFERLIVSPGTEDEEADDLSFMDGFHLDVETLVHNEILMNWPTKILCREDCQGICPVCGRNRNLGDCGCDTFVPDPRMAVIQDIFNKNKEV